MSEDRASVRTVDVVDAPRDVVFAAWTEPKRLKRWWGPGLFETVFAEVATSGPAADTSCFWSPGRCGWSASSAS